MSENNLKHFQDQVSELVLRHRSLLDILSKCHQTSSSVHRSITKAVTECGCMKLNAKKQSYVDNLTPEELAQHMKTHVEGEPCEQCREIISSELGRNLFYTAALCNVLNINLDDVIAKESTKCATLGFFNMS